MSKTPSEALFQDRLRAMILNRGIDAVARQYKRTPATVNKWFDSGSKPSAKIQTSVQRIGIKYTGAVEQTFNGRFDSTKNITTQNARQAEQAIIERYKDDLETKLRNATGSKTKQMIQTKIDDIGSWKAGMRAKIIELDAKLSRARETDSEDDWNDFRSSYSEM